MNKKLIYLLMFVFTLGLSFTACSDDDDDEIFNLVLESQTASVKVGEETTVKITKGNGGYTATSADPAKATAKYDANKGVIITGVAEGEVKVTVKDKANKSAEITVTVTADPEPDKDYAKVIEAIYDGFLAIPAFEIEGLEKDIELARTETNKLDLTLSDFSFPLSPGVNFPLGDIIVKNVPVTREGDVYTLEETDTQLKVMSPVTEQEVTVDVTITGTVTGDKLNLSIEVTNVPLVEKITVTFEGTKEEAETPAE